MRTAWFVLALAVAPAAAAQVIPARGEAYLFSAGVDDARALWINPAGLGVAAEASIYGEFAMDQAAASGDWGLRQYSLGLLSRQFGLSYQRDKGLIGGSQGVWRVGAGLPLGRRLALGTGISFTSPERGLDLGLRASPAPLLDLAAVVRNIGRPNVRAGKLPIILAAGISTRLVQGQLGLLGDAVATERLSPAAGFYWQYRAGAMVRMGGKTPLSLIAALHFQSDLQVDQLSVGLGLGRASQGIVVGTSLPPTGSTTHIESFSVAGVARSPTGAPRRQD